jgi:hypothetical protein
MPWGATRFAGLQFRFGKNFSLTLTFYEAHDLVIQENGKVGQPSAWRAARESKNQGGLYENAKPQ